MMLALAMVTKIRDKNPDDQNSVIRPQKSRVALFLVTGFLEIGGEGGEGAVNILYRGAEDRAARVAEYKEKFANPYIAAERGYVDEIIEPRFTRRKLITAFAMLRNKRDKNPPKKHGNIPL